jgi:hypothetical protein
MGRVTEYQAECKVTPFTKKEMERAVADLPTYKAGDAADLKSELIKAGGSALVKLLLTSELGMGTGDPARVVARVIVNLFKAGDTQLPGNYRGSPWYQSAARCLQTCCANRSQVHLHEAQAAFRKDPAQTTCSCSRILQEAGK